MLSPMKTSFFLFRHCRVCSAVSRRRRHCSGSQLHEQTREKHQSSCTACSSIDQDALRRIAEATYRAGGISRGCQSEDVEVEVT